ncbi:hypothetical protein FA048_09645 [Pedobacter polaris]|uniref:Lipid/polyisoprenoid-binding YceI-like domain-containing protein n=1 Tax=Pedobacter polaris TaxID=2571273 RepID=A0A4U1CW16_9SPHI|nr:hypothetical protein [Pedobacter polaris]TKC10439.1 hypothetical protein FA048_09645 [Pedobacter polaris]
MKKTLLLSFSIMFAVFLASAHLSKYLKFSAKFNNTEAGYQILNPKIAIAGSGKYKDWKLVIETFKMDARFLANEQVMEGVRDFSLSLKIDPLNSNGNKIETLILHAFQSSGCNTIEFTQTNLMILPMMKVVHMVGDLKAMKLVKSSPMNLIYVVDNERTITVKGKLFTRLSDFGISDPNIRLEALEDELTIYIEFTLKK